MMVLVNDAPHHFCNGPCSSFCVFFSMSPVILRSHVLLPKPGHLPHVALGECFPTGRYTHDDRIGMWVGCVYSPTEAWVHHHEWVLHPDQLDRIRKAINATPNGETGLFEIVDQKGKVVLYTDRHGHNRW